MSNPQPDQRQRYRALYTLLSAAALTLLAVSMLNVSIPSMTTALGLTSNDVQWIMAGYTLIFGLALIPAGRMGDTWGHRRLFVIGVVVFAVSSLGAGLAMNPLTLILMRLLAGVGAAIISPQVFGLIQILFRGQERARAYGSFGMIIGIATAIGPTMGGVLIALLGTNLGWRAAFLINIPICAVIIFVTFRTIAPDPARTASDTRLDLPGIFLLAAAFLAVMYPFIDATMPSGGLGNWRWLLLPGGALGFLGFWALENFRENRKIPVVMPRSLRLDPSLYGGHDFTNRFLCGLDGTIYYLHPLSAARLRNKPFGSWAFTDSFSAGFGDFLRPIFAPGHKVGALDFSDRLRPSDCFFDWHGTNNPSCLPQKYSLPANSFHVLFGFRVGNFLFSRPSILATFNTPW